MKQPSALSSQPSAIRLVWRGHSCPRLLKLVLLLNFVAFAAMPVFAQDKPVVLKGGKLLTITHGTIENGVLIMQGGKITAVGAASSVSIPGDAQVIDATGMTIYPGLIDSETQLGLTEISAEAMTNDLVEMSDEIMPHMHTYDAFHAESALIPVARLNGITNAIVAPESPDTMPGQDSFIQLAGRDSTEMLLIRDNAMPLELHRRRAPQQRRIRQAQISLDPHGAGRATATGLSGCPRLQGEVGGIRTQEIRFAVPRQ